MVVVGLIGFLWVFVGVGCGRGDRCGYGNRCGHGSWIVGFGFVFIGFVGGDWVFLGFRGGGWSVMEVEIGVAVEIDVAVGKMGFCHED